MPILASFIGALFAKLFEFFATFLTKRIAIIAAVIVAMTAVYLTFAGAVQLLINGLTLISPGTWFDYGLSMLPTNTNDCISAIMGGKIAAHLYIWNARIIQYKLL